MPLRTSPNLGAEPGKRARPRRKTQATCDILGDQKVNGCRIEMQPGHNPAECVLDLGRPDLCLYAEEIRRREQCQWWREDDAEDAKPGSKPGAARPQRNGKSGG